MSQKVEIHPHYAQVASQCLQSAYALNTEDKHLAVSKPLQAIFQEATKNEPVGSAMDIDNFKSIFFLSCKRSRPPPQPTRRRQND